MSFLGFCADMLGQIGWYVLPFTLILSVIVFFHELGHYLVGRWCGVKIDAFSLGFGPELFARVDKHGTRWRLALLPLGGYVKFYGDANAASAPDAAALEAMPVVERGQTLAGQPVIKRAAIVAAGPIANFLLAIAIFAAMFTVFGRHSLAPRVGSVEAGSPAEIAGFKRGDLIKTANGAPVASFDELTSVVAGSTGLPIAFTIERDGAPMKLDATPALELVDMGLLGKRRIGNLGLRPPTELRVVSMEKDSPAEIAGFKTGDLLKTADASPIGSLEDLRKAISGHSGAPVAFTVQRDGAIASIQATPTFGVVDRGPGGKQQSEKLGIRLTVEPLGQRLETCSIPVCVVWGVKATWSTVKQTGASVSGLFAGRESVDQLSGPIGIAQVAGVVAKISWLALFDLAALFSVSVGLMNLLPIPLLDGGHLLFYAIEAIRGRPLSERVQEIGLRIGIALVAMLVIFTTSHDIFRLVTGGSG